MTSQAATALHTCPEAFLSDEGPDFDAYIESVARNAAVFSKPIENFFTLALIVSLALTPFTVLQCLVPDLVVQIWSSAWVFAFIPYALVMSVLGMKVSSLFGCQTWWRVTHRWTAGY